MAVNDGRKCVDVELQVVMIKGLEFASSFT